MNSVKSQENAQILAPVIFSELGIRATTILKGGTVTQIELAANIFVRCCECRESWLVSKKDCDQLLVALDQHLLRLRFLLIEFNSEQALESYSDSQGRSRSRILDWLVSEMDGSYGLSKDLDFSYYWFRSCPSIDDLDFMVREVFGWDWPHVLNTLSPILTSSLECSWDPTRWVS
jgi:hypothetical protein